MTRIDKNGQELARIGRISQKKTRIYKNVIASKIRGLGLDVFPSCTFIRLSYKNCNATTLSTRASHSFKEFFTLNYLHFGTICNYTCDTNLIQPLIVYCK